MSTKQAQAKLNIEELKGFLRHIMNNNLSIQARGMVPVATEVEGDSGIGKTSSIIQLAEEMGLPVVKINLAQIEELGDLVGFPIRQFGLTSPTNGELEWLDENAVDEYVKLGYKFTGKKRMSYCPPEWIAGKEEGGILLLDDWNRADPRFVQATMELIDRQQYISWKLPKGWHIVLSANPDNGDYNVSSVDNAQKTRYISASLKFDIKCWAAWAEQAGIDGRCINFLLIHPELVTKNTNARSVTTFFNSISSIPTFEDQLPLIQLIGEGSVGGDFSSLFTMFINNRLDKLISPEDILFHKNEDHIVHTLKNAIGSKDKYRADIASTIATRIINYSLFFSEANPVTDDLIARLSKLVTEEIFTNDLKYQIAKAIYNGNKTKFAKLIMNKELVKFILK
jgi:hypothetical protein